MAFNYDPSAQQGIMGAIKGAMGLFNDTNKADGIDADSNPTPIDPYESSLDEVEILGLVKQWRGTYTMYYTPIEKGQKLSFDYWVGKHRSPDYTTSIPQAGGGTDMGVTDNLIFEAIETFLPIATRANPEPLVQSDPSDIGQEIAHDLKVALAYEADVQQLRRKLAKMTRIWLLNRIGGLKVCWNPVTKRIETEVVNTKKMVFDSEGFINEKGFFVGQYTGEKKRTSAGNLVKLFPTKASVIKEKAKDKMGTMLEYFEWWYAADGVSWLDTFYTLDDSVLGKYKNPNWNYDGTVNSIDPNTGLPTSNEVAGTNHLDCPPSPYRFLAIFSTSEQPHDNTSLILQNIPQQDKINRREQQIDKNVEGMNNGLVVSGTAFTEAQASEAASSLRRGVAIRVPNGSVKDAVMFPERPGLPGDVFQSLQDARSELRNIFGTAGSTAQGTSEQDTVRGKILVNQMDSSRIGGGITEYIEQVADSIYNLWTQFMFVYYDEEHFVASTGTIGGSELVSIKNDRFPSLQSLDITVKEGSLVPKDPLAQRNEAIDLWSANAIDPRTFYKRLDWPDPDEATNQLILWQMLQKGQIQPTQYLPSFAPAGQAPGTPVMGQPGMPQGEPQQPGTGGPPVSPPTNQDVSNPAQPQQSEGVAAQELLASQPIH